MDYHTLPAAYISHVSLNVSDIEQALVFYQKTLGFHILSKTKQRVSLTIDDEEPILTLYDVEQATHIKGEIPDIYHIALLLPERKYLAALYRYVWEKSDLFEGAADHLTSESLYLSDPDGNGVELYVDRNPSEWMWNERFVAMDLIPIDLDNLMEEAIEEKWKGVPKHTQIGHLHLTVNKVAPSTMFYTKMFPYEVVNEYKDRAVFLSTNKYHHHLALNTWNAKEPHMGKTLGVRSFTIEMTAKNRLKTVKHLEEHDFIVETRDGEYVVQDPTGNIVYF